jgi:hypothetical protein
MTNSVVPIANALKARTIRERFNGSTYLAKYFSLNEKKKKLLETIEIIAYGLFAVTSQSHSV